jgi:predicted TIM-barrel fold metal-dependent hydrolase
MIDMHAHWRPAELIDALRARTKEPRIVRNQDGVEVLKSRIGEEPLSQAFDDVGFHLARMDRQGVSTSVLSLLGAFCWIESQPVEVSLPLCRMVNDALSGICQKYDGRFSAFAALPLVEMSAAELVTLDREQLQRGSSIVQTLSPAEFLRTAKS